jgi:hypothetical protein
VNIRTFRPGDEAAQMKIYNTAAAALPKFKPASPTDLKRRIEAKDFDPATRLYVEDNGKVLGYCTYHLNGRVGYPWCLPGFESSAEALFAQTLHAMKARGITKAFTAYRKDWPTITAFFEKQGFILAREMVNFVMAFENMPTPSAKLSSNVTPIVVDDIPAIYDLDPTLFRVPDAEALRQTLLSNPWFTPDSVFVVRNREGAPQAAGVFITDAKYADPRAVDSSMPCFRLGAFGADGMTAKRIKGMFSFVARPDRNVFSFGMDLLSYAATRLSDEDDIWCFAGQIASDASALFTFYQRTFEKQGSFPVYERNLTK